MARFVKRGKKWQYEISIKKKDGSFDKIRKSGFATKSDAKSAATELEYQMSRGLSGERKNMLLSDYFKDWMELYKEGYVSEVTYLKYIDTYNNIERYMPHVLLSDLDRTKYQRYLNEFAKTHAQETVIKLNNHIRSSLKDAVEEGLITFDPTRKAILKGQASKRKKEDKYLDYDEFKSLMKLVEDGLNPAFASPILVIVAGVTGFRFSELLGLTWNDVDFESNTLDVNKTWNYKLKKWAPTKNESSVRKIPIDQYSMQLLKTHKAGQELLFENFSITNSNDFIFYNLKDGIVSSNAVNKYLKKKLKELGIDRNMTLHGLRHTHASILLYSGVNILNVSKRLGHANLETTMSTYLHIVKELEEKDADKINAVFDGVFKNDS
ncbi:site-specific integrase [Enterococcus avium]|uniref:tyrosine-type recombinase/integrase n=1 Tax=Enterococcus avium TaxID=33945 RepID=UPI00288C6E3E|nr:site-specific integrase [Enterococcus avium]MDT2436832.1 site-specific integrase [Enterococcus avium]MDT2466973.1 site-specific integrase [Enterococcus avium]MDT2485278.1 site-specific integrase [Enterococcus avium]MDT2506383.1 site-specific integrase [Enterococcus avium]MDT2511860.1 site-specific integrase [Enterococcus avium]